MTMQREDLDKGLEGDVCYWIAHERQMRGKFTWDARRDPLPDLVIEIEVSRSAMKKLAIYAALGVPEVWRFDSHRIRVEVLQPDGSYRHGEHSPTFPTVPLQGLLAYMQPDAERSYPDLLGDFRQWVRQQLPARR
jgi:Uma2 family endonuclease